MKTTLLSTLIFVLFLIFSNSVSAQQIWGMTKYGGTYQKGVIFKMDENAANQEVVFSFEVVGLPEAGLMEYSEGIYYGMSRSGGANQSGAIFRFESATGAFTKLIDFDGEQKGKNPRGGMIRATNGLLYGMTTMGGTSDKGVLFELEPTSGDYTKKVDFNGAEKGGEPLGSLLEATDGNFYGMTSMGGAHDAGVIFKYTPQSGAFTKIFDFDGGLMGANPMGSLMEASDGMLYGMTRWGGVNNHGVIFRLNPQNDQYDIVFEFDGPTTGRNPHGNLMEAANGKFYGMTPFGGAYSKGVLFEFDPVSLGFTVKYEFSGRVDSGAAYYGTPVQAPNGKLYGLLQPELFSEGVLFEFDLATDTYKRYYNDFSIFRSFSIGDQSLQVNSDGKLSFTAVDYNNELKNENSLIVFDSDNEKFIDQYKFSAITTGGFPYGSLVQASNGMLYGTTNIGGKYNRGVVFHIDPVSFSFTKVFDFEKTSKGANPNGCLIQGNNLKMYGLTREGGAYDYGVLYEVDMTTGAYLKQVDFDGALGKFPDGDLVKAENGNLYGITSEGGSLDKGVFFEFDPSTGSYNKLVDFGEVASGSNPIANSLVAAPNGLIYGTTRYGGAADKGVLFEYNILTETFSKLLDFGTSSLGSAPVNLCLGTDNNLYAYENRDALFQLDPVSLSYTEVIGDCMMYGNLSGKLLQASNGKMYGMDSGIIWYRATDFTGGIYEFDLQAGAFSQVLEFTGENGSNPENTSLIQLKEMTVPVAQCKNDTLYLDENGQATLLPADVDDGSTGEGLELTLSNNNFSCNEVGDNTVTLTASDKFGNSATCNALVTVADTIPPEVACQDIAVSLDAEGMADIDVSLVDNGSADACGISSRALDITSFSCENLGDNEVALTVADNHGNSAVCISTVTVTDDLAPEISCAPDMTQYLSPGETVYLAQDAEWQPEVTDNCGVESMVYGIHGEATAGNDAVSGLELEAGTHEISWQVTDGGGNVSSCTTMLIIQKRPVSLLLLKNELDKEKGEMQLEAVLLDDLLVEGVEGKSLKFSVDDSSRTGITDSNGKVAVAVPVGQKPSGSYQITAWFEEDVTYLGGTAETQVITSSRLVESTAVKVYPNPFSEWLRIEFTSPQTADARIDLYDSAGRLVKTVFNQPVEAGQYYKAAYRPRQQAGSYFIYRMTVGSWVHHGKILYRQ